MKTMKRTSKKVLSVFLAVMMLLSAWVFVAPEADAATTETTLNLAAYTSLTDGSGSRGSSSQITVCNDGEVGNTTVGNIYFDIGSLPAEVKDVTLHVNTTRNSGTAANSTVKFYMINPDKCLAQSGVYVLNRISEITGGYYNSPTGVNNAYNYFGVSESQALGTIVQTETGDHTFDVTAAVNTAKANGWSKFCLAFIMPQSYQDSDTSSWSDIHIQNSGTNLVCTYEADTATTVSAANSAALNSIPNFNTSVTTITDLNWAYNGDNQDNEPNVYKNILYSSDCNTITANTGSVNLKDSGAATLQWYHGVTTFLYDGITTPQTGVMLCTVPKGSSYNIRTYSSYISSGNGLSLAHYWYASDGRANFMWVISAPGNTGAATNDGSVNSTNAWTVNSSTWLANKLQFTGSMSNTEYYRDITVTWGWKGNQKSQDTGNVYTYTATSGNHIYVINYVPLKNALEEALGTGTYGISTLKNNTAKYTTASVAEYVAAVNALIAAKPNNYVNASTNNYSGYAKAAEAAVKKFTNAKANLTLQKYKVTFESLDGTVAKEAEYDYGSSINCTALAPTTNSVTQIAGNESYHQAYVWDNVGTKTIVNDITIKEITGGQAAHSYPETATDAGENHTWTCTVCDYVKTQAHTRDAGTITKVETCTEDGVKTYNCSLCGKEAIATETIDNIKGHDFNGDYVIKEDGENGTHYRKCIRCDAYGLGTIADACENHVWDKTATTASTCAVNGSETYNCKLCSATYTKTFDLADHKVTKTEAKDVSNICGGNGNVAFWTCSVCNRVWKDEALAEELTDKTDTNGNNIPDALETTGPDHEFTGAYVSVSGGENGTHKRQCKRFAQCNAYSEAEAHNYGEPVITDATCTATGKKDYTCSDCRQTYQVTLDKIAHAMTKIEAVAAECNKAGNNEYYQCSTCDKYFKDAAGTVQTTVEAEKIKALEHQWTEHHNYDTVKTTATCMSVAVYNKHCDYCELKLAGTYTYGDPDKINGHKFNGEIKKNDDGTHSSKCTIAGCTEYGNSTTCEYEITADVASTCKTQGYTTYVCKTCGYGYSDKKVLDYNNHTGEGTYVIANKTPTCASLGSTGIEKCKGCDVALSTKLNDIPVDSDNHEDMKDYGKVDSTCQTEGWEAYKYCSACQTYEIKKVTIVKKDHKFTAYSSNNDGTHTAICDTCAEGTEKATDTKNCTGGEATCIAQAICSVCEKAYGEVNGSNHKKMTTIESSAPDCLNSGNNKYYFCDDCDKYYKDAEGNTETTVETETLPALGHTFDNGNTDTMKPETDKLVSEATCQSAAVYQVTCDRCDAEKGNSTYSYGDPDLLNGHEYVGEIVDNKNGTHSFKCTVEGCAESGATVNCTYSVTEDVASTCKTAGYTVNTCSVCDNSYTTSKAKDSSNHEDMKDYSGVDSTCQTPGYSAYKYCSACDVYDVAKVAIAKKAHIFTIYASNGNGTHTATCDTCAEGSEKATDTKNCSGGIATCKDKAVCEVCDVTYGSKKADNHTSTEIYVANEKAATCQSKGYTGDTYYSCCNALKLNGTDIDKLSHTFTTYVSNGNSTHTATCDTCAEGTEKATDTKNCSGGTADCKEKAICSVCNVAYGEVNLKNHKSDDSVFEDYKEATCTEDGHTGMEYYACCYVEGGDNSGAIKTSGTVIPKKAHNFSEIVEEISATCIETGSITYKCSTCPEGQEVTDVKIFPVDNENHISTEVVVINKKAATCTTEGYTGDKYHACCYDENKSAAENNKARIEKGYAIKATGKHKLGKAVPEYLYDGIDAVSKTIKVKEDTLSYEDKISFRNKDDYYWYHIQLCEDCGEVVENRCYTYEHTSTCTTTDICEDCKGLCSLVNLKNHNDKLTFVPDVASTCKQQGTIAHYKCEGCEKLFYDEAGKRLVEKEEDLLTAVTIKHNMSEGATITANNDGTHSFLCKDCNEVVKVECSGGKATCTDKATCDLCNAEYGKIDQNNHASDEKIVVGRIEATCGSEGYTGDTYHKCCYDEKAEDNSAALDTVGTAIPADSRNHEIGYKDKDNDTHNEYCTKCQTVFSTSEHDWVADAIPEDVSCTDGYDLRSNCKYCNATKVEYIENAGHKFEETVTEIAATCETSGSKVTVKACKNCGVSETKTETIKAFGHDERRMNGVAATCTAAGSTDYIYCYRCDTVLQESTAIPARGCIDSDRNGFCDSCYSKVEVIIDPSECDCMCHIDTPIGRLFHKIALFFWKLFKTNKTCCNGTVHY